MSVSTYTSGSGNWTADDTSATVECWGGGATGLNGRGGSGSQGGGGGEYAIKAVSGLTIGNNYAYVVGAVGSSSTFQSTTVVAIGATVGTGATGGTGDTKYAGGNAGNGVNGGGGGGSSGGTSATGNPGSNATGGTGGAGGTQTGAGSGGRGGDAGVSNAAAGTQPGGGGGGGSAPTNSGGAGAAGQVRITTNPVVPSVSSLLYPSFQASPNKPVAAGWMKHVTDLSDLLWPRRELLPSLCGVVARQDAGGSAGLERTLMAHIAAAMAWDAGESVVFPAGWRPTPGGIYVPCWTFDTQSESSGWVYSRRCLQRRRDCPRPLTQAL